MIERHRVVLLLLVPCWFIFATRSPGAQPQTDAVQNQTTEASDSQDSDSHEAIEKRQSTRFLRVLADEYGEPVALQTATVRYIKTGEQGNVELEVFLETVIHIADASYYRGFEKRFEHYDCVLHELVLQPKESDSDENGGPSGLRLLQDLSAGSLGLSYQFDEINYQRENFVHADLTTDEIGERFRERGENQVTLLTDLLAHLSQQTNSEVVDDGPATEDDQQDKGAKIKIDLGILTDPDGIMKIRRLLATTFGETEILQSVIPPALHQVIVQDRNQRAMSVLQQQLAQGKRRIAFLWGAGHMADFEQRLMVDYGLKHEGINWRNAWDLRDGAIEGAPLEGLLETTFKDSVKDKLRGLVRRSGQKRKADMETKKAVQADKRIAEMEAALKALEAKLESLEQQETAREQKDDKKET